MAKTAIGFITIQVTIEVDRPYLVWHDGDEPYAVPVALGASPYAIETGVKTTILRDRNVTG